MKISSSSIDVMPGAKSAGTVGTDRSEAKPSPGTAVSAQGVDRAGFSSTIKSMGKEVAAGGVVDQAKVERISQAIADGTFEVNPEAVADGMIRSAAELLTRRS